MQPLAVVGNVNVDMILGPAAPWPLPGSEIMVEHSELRVGGSAANSALTWKGLGAAFQFVANTGNDLYGAWMRDQLVPQSEGWTVSDGPSTVSVGITHPDGERTFFTNTGHLLDLGWQEVRDGIDWPALAGGWLLLCGTFLTPRLARDLPELFAHCQARNVRVALDTGWPPEGWEGDTRRRAGDWLRGTDCLLVNEAEATALSGQRDPRLAGEALLDKLRPDGMVVVKIGPGGALVFQGAAEIRAAAPEVRVVDTIGAGDVFNASFLKSLAEGHSLDEAATQGVRTASYAISTFPRSYDAGPG
ncbi:carbohydrate kinase family protein [Tropicimonas isoalkanivorans]|uniref:Sugar or nucleoside kinase, ribokinase family n=1 Tax=Tropicimonas isoalkanivorans TaxID=441112 RepID=A0A1I1DEX3_9RHOB|nr:carbohydrate kinase family protein [Tropicimonas isoalkanivorans]SFB73471.1 Sugar or nucleoside kinase, ribokinase family [Tropicimonas isoalkanivorans]